MADEIPLKGLSNGLNRPIFLKNCPIKKIDGKWLVLKDIIYQVMSGTLPTDAIKENFI